MKKTLILILTSILIVQLVNAAEVCVIAYYPTGEADSKCISIEEGKSGYELMEEIGWSLLWSPESAFGRMLCKINDVGTDVSGQYCAYNGDFWNIVLNRNKEWIHLPIGLDAPGGCWNYDMNSWDGHYCTKNGDVLGLAFGPAGSKPEMFKVNITKIYVDGEKQSDSKTRRGKIVDVFPESTIEFKIELENLYHHSIDIDILDVSIEGTIEEISDGEDIEEYISEFDLKADKKITEELEFTIPLEVDAKDRLVTIEIDAEDDAGIKYKKKFTYDLEVEKEQHNLKILKAELNKDSYKCGENVLLELSIINIGAKNEDIDLQIANEDLDIDINENFELSNDAFEPSSKYENKFNIWLPNNDVSKGTYPIEITADYKNEKEIENINLILSESCKKSEQPKETEEITDVQTGIISETEETEAGISEEGMTIKETITKNLPLLLTVVLGILIISVILLFVLFLIFRRGSATPK